jgi:hypothetical protein
MRNTRETMKSILLATASIVAFAGVAAAQEGPADGIALSGAGAFGYNDEIEDGFFLEGSIAFTMTRTLDSGLVAGAEFGFDIEDSGEDDFPLVDVELGGDFVLSLTDAAGTSGLFVGATPFAAEHRWATDVDLLSGADFSEQGDETVLRGDIEFAGIGASVSYNLADAEGDGANDVDQLSVGAAGTFGAFNFSLGYQEESDAAFAGDGDDSAEGVYDEDGDDDFDPSEVFAIGASTTFNGFDVSIAYANNMTAENDSLGVGVSAPFGPVTFGADYVLELNEDEEDSWRVEANYVEGPIDAVVFYESDQGEEDFGVEADYDLGNGILLRAGFIDSTGGYAGGEISVGEGATVIVSYAESDEEGRPEYRQGTTIALSFEF